MKKIFTLMLLVLATLGAKAQVEWTIWEGTLNTSDTENEWNHALSLNVADFTSIETGDIIYVYATQNSGTSYVSKSFGTQTGEGWTWGNFTTTPTLTDSGNNADYYFVVTSAFITEISASDFKAMLVRGCNYTISKVTVKKNTSMIKHTISTDAVNFANWGGIWSKELPATVAAGDFFYLTATQADASYHQAKFYDGTNSPSKWQYDNSGFDHDIWAKVQAADVTNINAAKVTAQGYYYNTTGFYLYHPIPSFSIGSIGMATFSADVAVRVPNGIEAYRATLNDAKTAITLTKIEDGIIPANTGVIIKGTEGTVVEFTATTTESSITSVLTANVNATTMTAGDYVLYNNGGTAEFRKVTATQLAANKAYLPASALSSPAPSLSISFDGMGNTTGISNVQKTVVEDNRIYNLNGQEVKNAGKGIFIKNGKKYIIK